MLLFNLCASIYLSNAFVKSSEFAQLYILVRLAITYHLQQEFMSTIQGQQLIMCVATQKRELIFILTSAGVAKTKRYWIASIKTPGFALARPTAQIACSSRVCSWHCSSLEIVKSIQRLEGTSVACLHRPLMRTQDHFVLLIKPNFAVYLIQVNTWEYLQTYY